MPCIFCVRIHGATQKFREFKQGAQTGCRMPNISNIITSDETWMYGYDPETKQQSSQWKSSNSPQPKKACQVRSNVKSMLIIFFDIQGIVHKEFIPPGQTVNAKFYCEVLKRSLGANVQTSGRKTIGFSTMTTHLLTHHSLFNNS